MLTLRIEDITIEANIRHDVGEVEELASSIDRVGLLQPLIVTETNPGSNDPGYTLVAGARRLAAIKSLDWDAVDCVLNDTFETAAEIIEAQYVENTQRVSLTDWEEAQVAYDLKLEGLTQPQVAEAMGLAKSDVSKLQAIVKTLQSAEGIDEVADQFNRQALSELAKSDVVEHATEVLQLVLDGEAASIEQAERKVEDTQELIAFRDENAAQIKEWSEAGIEMSHEDPAYHWGKQNDWGQPSRDLKVQQLDTQGNTFGISVRDHITLDCHMIWINEAEGYWTPPSINHYCMDSKSHTQKGKSEVKTIDAEAVQLQKDKDSKARKIDRDDKNLRRQQAKVWLSKLGKQADVYELAVRSALTTWREDHIRAAIALLGFTKERPVGADYAWYQKRLATYLTEKFGDDETAIDRWKVRMLEAHRYIELQFPGATAKEQLTAIEVDSE